MNPHFASGLAPLAIFVVVVGNVAVRAQDGLAARPVPVPGPAAASTPGPYDLVVDYVNTPGHPANLVPGLGLPFAPGGGPASAFSRPFSSGDGSQLAIRCVAMTGSTADDSVLLENGALRLQEGQPAPWAPGQLVGPINETLGLNNAGSILLANNVSPATLADDYVVLWSAGVWTVQAQDASPTPVLPHGAAGAWGSSLDGCVLTDAGAPLWRALGLVGGVPTANNAVVVLPGGNFVQKGISVPSNQAGGAMDAWESFDTEDVYASPDGLQVLIQGDTLGATTADDVLVLNGVVVIQEGSILSGSTFANPVNTNGLGIVRAWIDRAGNWYARGNNVGADDWVVRNGLVVAESSGSNEVVVGSGEHWDDATFADCFFAFDGNHLGQYVLGGVTDAPAASNGVLVFDDGAGFRRVICREGDPIDLDGNGLFDDDRYFDTFGSDDVRLLDDGTIVFTATLKNFGGMAVDQGLFHLSPRLASCSLRNGSGVNPVVCTCASLPVLGTTWTIAVAPSPNTLLTLAYVSTAPFGPFPLFGGELLIDPAAVSLPGNGMHPVPLPLSPAYFGFPLSVQGVRLELVGPTVALQLTNAQDAVLGL